MSGEWVELWNRAEDTTSVFEADPGPRDPGWVMVVVPKLSPEEWAALLSLPLHDIGYSRECESFSPFLMFDAIRTIVPEARIIHLSAMGSSDPG